ncbi:SusC/RagA family TonB-linked outer membrane protein [Viscerimonas tarda]
MKLHFYSKSKRMFLFLLAGIFNFAVLNAQTGGNIPITGLVKDTYGEPVIGASVVVKGTTNGAVTDLNGKFTLSVPEKGTLIISFLGFIPKEINVNSEKHIDVILEENQQLLDEVVVIGYGQVRKADATGSVTTIKLDDFNKGNQVTVQDALVGKMAGLNVTPGGGSPNDAGTIRIRMGASLSASNDPMIVIDGLPVSGNSINMINPDDVASVTVLKDASATAIYGFRASNGVIIITTKKGDSGKKQAPKLNYNNNFSLSQIVKYNDVLTADEYRALFANLSQVSGAQLGNANTNWQKEIFQTAFSQDHNLSVTGATKYLPYRVSLGFTDQSGIIRTNNYRRTNLSVNLSPSFFNDHLKFDINVKGSIEDDSPVSTGVIGSAMSFDPTTPVYETYPGDVGLGYFMWMDQSGNPFSQAPTNPLSQLYCINKNRITNRSIGNMMINYKIHGLEDLVLTANFGYDIRRQNYKEDIPDKAPSTYTGVWQDATGQKIRNINDNSNKLLDLYGTYSKTLGKKHNLNAMAGYSYQTFYYHNDEKRMKLDDTFVNGFPPVEDEGKLVLASLFGRLNYSYDSRYLLTFTMRSDATSRFSPEDRWGYFPSAAFAWRIMEEKFMKGASTVLSDLKLRLSYGKTGQQNIGSYYEWMPTYTASREGANYLFGDEWITTYRPNGKDVHVHWETTETYNAGLDFGFFKNRITGSVDLYTRNTYDLLNFIYVPAGSNFTNRLDTNIGDMESKGIETSLNFVPVHNKDWYWSIGGNFTWNTSKITKLNIIESDNNFVLTGNAGGSTGRYLQVHMVDQTPYTFFLLKQAYDDNGRPLEGQYIAKDGTIGASTSDENKYLAGSALAPYYYGLTTKLSYRRWEFGANAHGSWGNKVFNWGDAHSSLDGIRASSTGITSNVRWNNVVTGFRNPQEFSDLFLENGAFFKLDNISLGYNFPKLWNKKSNLRLTFTVQNVATITQFSGLDPEIHGGIDNTIYPRPRMYILGMNFNF